MRVHRPNPCPPTLDPPPPKKTNPRWLAFIDGDEFIVFKGASRTRNIEEFMTDYEGYGGLALNWCAGAPGGGEVGEQAYAGAAAPAPRPLTARSSGDAGGGVEG
jgi:hypothetical protein